MILKRYPPALRNIWFRRSLWLLLALALLALPLTMHAQGDDTPTDVAGQQYKFDHLTPDDGLLSSAARQIVQDSRGFIWIATPNGLNRYDGYTFKAFEPDPDDPHSISQNNVFSLLEDSRGVLWVGTWGGGLNRFDRGTEYFTAYQHDPADPHSLSNDTINALYEDRSGRLWVSTDNGLNQFDPITGQFTRFVHDPDDPNSLSDNQVWEIVEDATGILWVGTKQGGLNKFDPTTGQFTRFVHDPDDPNSLSHNQVQTVVTDPRGGLWVGTGDGLDFFDPDSGQFAHYRHDPEDPQSLGHHDILSLYLDSAGDLWVGTDGRGLNKFDRNSYTFERFESDPDDPHSFRGASIEHIFEDNTGTVWISTFGNGINQFDRSALKFELYQNNPNNPNSLSSNAVWSIFEDSNNLIWIGTLDGGLNRFDPTTNQFTHYRHDPDDPASLSDGQVRTIFEDEDGILWIGTPGSLDRLDPETEQFTRYLPDPADPDSLRLANFGVDSILVDRSDRFWVGAGGLNLFNPETGQFTHYQHDPDDPNSISDDNVGYILEDSSGMLWLSTFYGGLNKFDPVTEQFTRYQHNPDDPNSLSNNQIQPIYEDSDGMLWIGGAGGLDKFDPQTETFLRNYRTKDGLPTDLVLSIVPDEQGYLWLGTFGGGLSRFDPREETFKNYDESDGLQGLEFFPGAIRSHDGKLYFVGLNGINAFYPEQIQDNPNLPPVVLTDFQLFNQSVPIGAEDSPLEKVINEVEEVTLTHSDSVFSIEFAALNYRFPEKNEYAYMLEGFDQDWNFVDSSRRYATYTNLDPGEYTFRVKASNNDGVWNEEGLSLPFTITPPWWETTWFRGLTGLLVIGAITGVFLGQRQISKRRERILESQLAERTEELASFLDLTMLISDNYNLDEVLQGALDRIIDFGLCQAVCVHLVAEDQAHLKMFTSRGLSKFQHDQLQRLPLDGDLSEWFTDRQKQVLTLDLSSVTTSITPLRLEGYNYLLGVPLETRSQILGLISYYRVEDQPYSLDDISMLTALAEQLRIIIENHWLRDEIEEIAIVSERQRLARDMHDSINQSLYSLGLFTLAGREAAEDGDTERLIKSLKRIEEISLDARREMRLLLLQLRPPILTELGLAEALQYRFDTVERSLGTTVDYQVDGHLDLPDKTAEGLYWVTLEILNNSLKHSKANQVTVRMEMVAPTVNIKVSDNGIGFNPELASGGMGLKNIEERIDEMDGWIKISSAPGEGTTIEFAISVPEMSDTGQD